MSNDDVRDGVALTNLDQPLFDGAGATKREFVDYLDAVADRMLPGLRDRPLSVVRILRGQDAFMQKNLPKYTPDWVRTVPVWAEASKREISYALCNDRATLLWFANQRAVEYHPTLYRVDQRDRPTHLVLDIDPPEGAAFRVALQAALLVRQALADVGMTAALKTSGAKGVHVMVPVADAGTEEVAAATRAIGIRRPSSTRAAFSGCGSGIRSAHGSAPAIKASAVCTVKSRGSTPSSESQASG